MLYCKRLSLLIGKRYNLQPPTELIYDHQHMLICLSLSFNGPKMSKCTPSPGLPAWQFCSGTLRWWCNLLFTLLVAHVATCKCTSWPIPYQYNLLSILSNVLSQTRCQHTWSSWNALRMCCFCADVPLFMLTGCWCSCWHTLDSTCLVDYLVLLVSSIGSMKASLMSLNSFTVGCADNCSMLFVKYVVIDSNHLSPALRTGQTTGGFAAPSCCASTVSPPFNCLVASHGCTLPSSRDSPHCPSPSLCNPLLLPMSVDNLCGSQTLEV